MTTPSRIGAALRYVGSLECHLGIKHRMVAMNPVQAVMLTGWLAAISQPAVPDRGADSTYEGDAAGLRRVWSVAIGRTGRIGAWSCAGVIPKRRGG
jgi:hypothetical protein